MCSDNFLFLPKTSQIFSEKVQVLVASLSLAPTHQLMATQASILAPLTINIEGVSWAPLPLLHIFHLSQTSDWYDSGYFLLFIFFAFFPLEIKSYYFCCFWNLFLLSIESFSSPMLLLIIQRKDEIDIFEHLDRDIVHGRMCCHWKMSLLFNVHDFFAHFICLCIILWIWFYALVVKRPTH